METDDGDSSETNFYIANEPEENTSFVKYFSLGLFMVLPFLGFWLGFTYSQPAPQVVNIVNKPVGVVDEILVVEEEYPEVVQEKQPLPEKVFDIAYRGTVIEGMTVSLRQQDYASMDSSSVNGKLWSTPYFILDNKVYYTDDYYSATSTELVGVDADSFRRVEQRRSDHNYYVRDKVCTPKLRQQIINSKKLPSDNLLQTLPAVHTQAKSEVASYYNTQYTSQ